MITRFNHTGIVVQDLDLMERFYTEDIGLKTFRRLDSVAPLEGNHTGIPGARRTLLFLGIEDNHQIELVHYIDPLAAKGHLDKHQFGATHICFDVEDLQETYDELSAKGVRFVTEPKYRQVNGRTLGAIYAQDPEGNWLEFIEGSVAIAPKSTN